MTHRGLEKGILNAINVVPFLFRVSYEWYGRNFLVKDALQHKLLLGFKKENHLHVPFCEPVPNLHQVVNSEVAKWTACMPKEADENLFAFVGFQIDGSVKNVNEAKGRCCYIKLNN